MGIVRMCGGRGDEHKILVGNSEGKRLLGKIRVDGRLCYNGSYVHTVYRLDSSGRGQGLVAGSCQ